MCPYFHSDSVPLLLAIRHENQQSIVAADSQFKVLAIFSAELHSYPDMRGADPAKDSIAPNITQLNPTI